MRWDWLVVAIFMLICAGILFLAFEAKTACEESGGRYVKGLYAYECI